MNLSVVRSDTKAPKASLDQFAGGFPQRALAMDLVSNDLREHPCEAAGGSTSTEAPHHQAPHPPEPAPQPALPRPPAMIQNFEGSLNC